MIQNTVKLLIVDDQESVHRALALSLRREPYEILHAYDAAEAFHILEQHPEVLGIISDHNMPGLSGVDFLVQVRLKWPEIQSVLLTAEATVELAESAVNAAGVRGLLAKPWKADNLRSLLREMLLPGTEQSVSQQAAEAAERALREQMQPARDPETGAFIIDEDLP
ncbi:MAG: response regulator [Planctomycetota bacterium]|nr:response regulator [Planctomycetota bacterium]